MGKNIGSMDGKKNNFSLKSKMCGVKKLLVGLKRIT